MKKLLAVLLVCTLSACAFAVPVNAARAGGRYYSQFLGQYFDGEEPEIYDDCEPYVYEELYYHETGGQTDWALIRADVGDHAEVIICDIFFGRYFYQCDIAYPFEYTYGIYDAARERFFDLREIGDETLYPDLQEVFDRFNVGRRVGGEPLFLENFCRFASWEGTPYSDVDLASYAELSYHYNAEGRLDWVLVQGKTNMARPLEVYRVIGDRVFRSTSLCVPFEFPYGVFDVEKQRFTDMTQVWNTERYRGLFDDFEALDLGERIGDLNGNGQLDVDDATEIQRCLAEYRDYPADDGVEADGFINRGGESIQYISDINGDGVRNVRDVTAAQRALAE